MKEYNNIIIEQEKQNNMFNTKKKKYFVNFLRQGQHSSVHVYTIISNVNNQDAIFINVIYLTDQYLLLLASPADPSVDPGGV